MGGLSFVSRTFEGSFKENPYILDMDANLYIGPADQISRDEHPGIELVYYFLVQTKRIDKPLRELLRNRTTLLSAFDEFDKARADSEKEEFRIRLFGTYDGEGLVGIEDDEFPAGPCGMSVNEIKRRFYLICKRSDKQFATHKLSDADKSIEARFINTV